MRNISLALVLAVTACGSSSPPPPDHRFDALAAAIEADLASSAATGASVAVWLDDEIVWVGGFGTADPAGGLPPDEDTRFQIGSDTKKLTALSLLREQSAYCERHLGPDSDCAASTRVALSELEHHDYLPARLAQHIGGDGAPSPWARRLTERLGHAQRCAPDKVGIGGERSVTPADGGTISD
jgi:hypothetical protein